MLRAVVMAMFVGASAIGCAAMDVVTLQNGKILRGEIYGRDDDGSLLMNLTDRTKRYVMPEEYTSVTNDGQPFRYQVGANSGKSFDVMVYAGYEQIMPTSLTLGGHNAKIYTSSPGFVAGVSVNMPLKWNLSFHPGVELAYSKSDRNDVFKFDGVEAEADGQLAGWLDLRIPLQLGYEFKITDNVKLLAHTGPVIQAYIGWMYDGGMDFGQCHEGFDGYDYDANNGYGGPVYGSWYHNRVNVDWRFGVRASYKRLSLGLAYSVGMTNRLTDVRVKGSHKGSMRKNVFQLSLGWTF